MSNQEAKPRELWTSSSNIETKTSSGLHQKTYIAIEELGQKSNTTGDRDFWVIKPAYDSLLSEAMKLRDALEFYANKEHWKSVTVEDTNRRFCIMQGSDLEYFEHENQNSFCGKSARSTLANFDKFLKDRESK